MTVSILAGIFYLLIAGTIGFFLSNFIGKKKFVDWEGQYNEEHKNFEEANKLVKKNQKHLNNANQQVLALKEKINSTEEKYIPLNKSLQQELTESKKNFASKESECANVDSQLKITTHRYDKMKAEFDKFKEKYASDLGDSKGWKTKRDQLIKDIETLNLRLAKADRKNKELNKKVEMQAQMVLDAENSKKEFRVMVSENKRLTKDLAYWEKKHYDTHHELAKTKEAIEKVNDDNKELDLLIKGNEIKEQNMMAKLQEYKTKFVNMNNKYHEMVNGNK